MNRVEYKRYIKRYGLAILCVLPILIVLDILIQNHVPMWVMVIIDVCIILIAFVVAQVIADKRLASRIKRREEREKAQGGEVITAKANLIEKSPQNPDVNKNQSPQQGAKSKNNKRKKG